MAFGSGRDNGTSSVRIRQLTWSPRPGSRLAWPESPGPACLVWPISPAPNTKHRALDTPQAIHRRIVVDPETSSLAFKGTIRRHRYSKCGLEGVGSSQERSRLHRHPPSPTNAPKTLGTERAGQEVTPLLHSLTPFLRLSGVSSGQDCGRLQLHLSIPTSLQGSHASLRQRWIVAGPGDSQITWRISLSSPKTSSFVLAGLGVAL